MKRIPSLDGLRAASILLVFAGHLYGTAGYPRNPYTHAAAMYAHLGVQVFFVISGFLITSLLLREQRETGTINLPQFFFRRTIRIFPASYFYIAALALLTHVGYFGYALTYSMCYASQERPWVLGHLWSLSVEEQFYLLWPFALAFGFRWRKEAAVALLVLAPIARALFWLAGMYSIDEYFPAVMDSMATGCLVAMIYSRMPRFLAQLRFLLPAGFLLLGAPLLDTHPRLFIPTAGLVPALIALCVYGLIKRADWVFNNPITSRVGALSYSLYLWQQPFLNKGSHHWWTTFPLNLGATLTCAVVSYYAVEQPFLAMRKRFEKADTYALPATS